MPGLHAPARACSLVSADAGAVLVLRGRTLFVSGVVDVVLVRVHRLLRLHRLCGHGLRAGWVVVRVWWLRESGHARVLTQRVEPMT